MARTHNISLPQGGTIKLGVEDRLPEQVVTVYEEHEALRREFLDLSVEFEDLKEAVATLKAQVGALEQESG